MEKWVTDPSSPAHKRSDPFDELGLAGEGGPGGDWGCYRQICTDWRETGS